MSNIRRTLIAFKHDHLNRIETYNSPLSEKATNSSSLYTIFVVSKKIAAIIKRWLKHRKFLLANNNNSIDIRRFEAIADHSFLIDAALNCRHILSHIFSANRYMYVYLL